MKTIITVLMGTLFSTAALADDGAWHEGDYIDLYSAYVVNGKFMIGTDKNYDTAGRLRNELGESPPGSSFCSSWFQGPYLLVCSPDADQRAWLEAAETVKLCHGNNASKCSESLAIDFLSLEIQ